jgi:YaiO family outer membrane protein
MFFCGNTFAQYEPGKKNRLEAKFSYEYLTPDSVYGSRRSLLIDYHNRFRSDLSYFVQLGAFTRDEGDAMLGSLGAYKDWGSRFYTYSALSAATNSEYLPRFRIDNDFNVKLGNKNNFVWTVGVSYIKYFDVHKDFIVSTGFTLYRGEWILSYRIFRNDSDPGDVISYSQIANVGYGREGWQWTYVDVSYGKQAYLTSNLTSPEEVSQNAFYVNLKHRRWIQNGYGVILELGFFTLDDGYEKYTVLPGIFMEF